MRLRFGGCELDSGRRLLTRDGRTVHLSPKAFLLLQLFINSAGRALRKDELHDALWPDTHVQEANLKKVVRELRAAVDSGGNSCIRTIFGFGYAFEAVIEDEQSRSRPAHATLDYVYRLISRTETFDLRTGENVLGRVENSAVPLNSAKVSRSHARIIITEQGAVVEDLASHNGTYVGGRRISEPTVLRDGDEIRLGSASLTFRATPRLETTESEIV